jgi:hypothetical protein
MMEDEEKEESPIVKSKPFRQRIPLKTIAQENDDIESQVSRQQKSNDLKEMRRQAKIRRSEENKEPMVIV